MVYLILRLFTASFLLSSVFATWAQAQSSGGRPAWRSAINETRQAEHCQYFVSCVRTGQPPAGSASDQQCFSYDRSVARAGAAVPSCTSGSNPWAEIERQATMPASRTITGISEEQRIAQEIIRQRNYCYEVERRPNREPRTCPNHRETTIQCENASAQCVETSFCYSPISLKCMVYNIFSSKSNGSAEPAPKVDTEAVNLRDTPTADASANSAPSRATQPAAAGADTH